MSTLGKTCLLEDGKKGWKGNFKKKTTNPWNFINVDKIFKKERLSHQGRIFRENKDKEISPVDLLIGKSL